MNGISPWAIKANAVFAEDEPETFNLQSGEFTFNGHITSDSLWVYVSWANSANLGFRPVYAPDGTLEITDSNEIEDGYEFNLTSLAGRYHVEIRILKGEKPVLHYTTTLTPAADLLIPFWPRDIIALGKDGKPEKTAGNIVVNQVGTRSGQLYFMLDKPRAGAVFYLQNLTALMIIVSRRKHLRGALSAANGPRWDLPYRLPLKASPYRPAKVSL
jgi:hypothetical protein